MPISAENSIFPLGTTGNTGRRVVEKRAVSQECPLQVLSGSARIEEDGIGWVELTRALDPVCWW